MSWSSIAVVVGVEGDCLPFASTTDLTSECTDTQVDPSDGKLHPCAFRSEKLSGAELNYSINDKELCIHCSSSGSLASLSSWVPWH